ncbi:MAG: RdgB/HAM1 family non-canonical purine NTP pyrophosphatase [Bacillota bacterium]
MKRIVVATRNEGKLNEIRPALTHLGYEVYSLLDFDVPDIAETGKTLRENALIKARTIRKVTDYSVLADDSGLEVEALNGAPGVHSKRFSNTALDHDNNELLLKKMANKENRAATFKTVMVLITQDDKEYAFEGTLHGYIHTVMEGNAGFGYDSVFIPVGHSKTLATLGMGVKNDISHRRRALRQVVDFIRDETL